MFVQPSPGVPLYLGRWQIYKYKIWQVKLRKRDGLKDEYFDYHK